MIRVYSVYGIKAILKYGHAGMAPAKAAAPHRAALRLAVHAVLLSFDFLDSARHSSSQRVKFVNGEVRLSEQFLEEPDPELRVLRN